MDLVDCRGTHGLPCTFDRKLLHFLSNKNPPGDAHSRDKKMSLMRPLSAREFRERNSLFLKVIFIGIFHTIVGGID